MSRLFLTNIDANWLEVYKLKLQNLSATSIANISSPSAGMVAFDTTNHVLKVYDGTAWTSSGGAASGSGAPSSTPTSVGQLYIDTTNNVLYVSNGTSSSANWVTTDPRGATGDMTTPSLDSANAAGTSLKVAPIDHVHRHTDTDHSGIHISALATPQSNVAWNSKKITGLADPTDPQDAATKYYVDQARNGLDAKAAARLATTANLASITYSATGGTSLRGQITGAPGSLDGLPLAQYDRVLIKDQTDKTVNGIWVVSTLGTGANGVWDRATDFDTDAEVKAGAYVWVTEGNTQADTAWVLTTDNPITIGGSSGSDIVWVLFSSAGSVIAGAGLTKSGNTLDVGTASSSRIVVNTDNIDLASVSQTNPSGTAGTSFVQSVAVDSYGRVTGQTTASVQDATTSAKGIASFDSGDFSVSTGAVSIKSGGVDNSQLAHSAVTINGGTNITVTGGGDLSLGGTASIALSGQVAVANGGTGASTAAGARTNLGATTKVTGTNSAGTSTVVNHALGQWVTVQLFDSTTGAQVEADIANASTDGGTTTITTAVSQSAGAYTYVIIG